jgi:putative ABC transport system permease protein
VINQYLAEKLWPGQNAIGHHFRRGMDDAQPVEVVGVVKYSKATFIAEDPGPYFYVPLTQNYSSVRVLHVHSSLPSADIAREVQAQVHALDPNLPVFDVMPMATSLEGGNGYFFMRIAATFAGALGGLSLLLAVVGMYGVISYAVNQRIHEIAVRIALGAQKQNIFGMVIGYGLKLVGAGLVIGVAIAAGLSRFLESLLVNTGALDPIAYVSASLVLVGVAALGCYVPARRAVRVDPMITLRYE